MNLISSHILIYLNKKLEILVWKQWKPKSRSLNEFKYSNQFINLQQSFKRSHFKMKQSKLMVRLTLSLEMRLKCLMKMMSLSKSLNQYTYQAKFQQIRNAFFAKKYWQKKKFLLIQKFALVWIKKFLSKFSKWKKIQMRKVKILSIEASLKIIMKRTQMMIALSSKILMRMILRL